jgi:pimeloyl-ACP methyl ester carboxylesterase
MFRGKAFLLVAVVLISVAGCAKAKPASGPAYESAACQFDVPDGYEVECGYLTVPEDRSRPGDGTIRLHVGVFKSRSPTPAPDPVIHLVGGPGGSLLDAIPYHTVGILDGVLETRDYIVFDQRGTHYASPTLDCPGYGDLMRELAEQGLGRAEWDERETEFLLSCHDDLIEQGIDLSAYNSAQNAADVEDLRVALGYDRVNLYGVSYGSRLALTIMRDYPAKVRSVIIDSVYPPQVAIEHSISASAMRAFHKIFEDCAADQYCSTTYPDLQATFYRAFDELNANPAQIVVDGTTVTVNGYHLIDLVFGMQYIKDAIPWIPAAITSIDRGNLQTLAPVFENKFSDEISQGMYYSIQCHEEVAFESYEQAQALAVDVTAPFRENYVSPTIYTLCESWQSGVADPIENEPVVSDIPTLVLAGAYDAVTPAAYGRLAAETLSESFFFEFPGVGHGVVRSNDCALEIALRFLDDPTTEPEASCIGDLPGPGYFK